MTAPARRAASGSPARPAPPVLPEPLAEVLADLGDRVVIHDLYDEVGAQLYHGLTRDDRYELRELLAAVRRTSGPVLDLAAGSGRLTLPFLAQGRDVTALERSPAMVALLEAELAALPAGSRRRCTVVRADMADFDLPVRYGAVVLGTTSITLLDDAGRADLYRAVSRHLAPGGRFVATTLERDGDEPPFVEMEVDLPDGPRLLVQHWPAGAAERTVTLVPRDPAAVLTSRPGGEVPVVTSRSRVVTSGRLVDELTAAGFVVVRRRAVAGGGPRRLSVIEAEARS